MENNNNKPVFYLIAVLLPFVILALFEWTLRLTNIGDRPSVFVASPVSDDYLMPNPKLIERYFSHPALAPNVSPDTVYFKKQKDPDTIRIVIQGGSTAAGFPFGRFGSLQGMLEQRLKNTYPDHKFELINTAMAAVNTFTLLDIQDDILALEPDYVLIYTGHNEYVGILGSGSVFGGGSYASTLLYTKLKQFNLFNAIEHWYAEQFVLPKLSQQNKQSERSTMAKAAKGQKVPLHSELYQQGVTQFESNISLLLKGYQRHQVPVLIGNLVSIENGLAPFSALENKQDSAYQHYLEAQKSLASGDIEQGIQWFKQAKDLDQFRFRAPSVFNDILRHLTDSLSLEKDTPDRITLVDVESAFRASSRELSNKNNGVLGAELFLEHVHPTKRGYFVLADTFFLSLKTKLDQAFETISSPVDAEEAYAWVPITELDEAYATLKIAGLLSGFPFTQEAEDESITGLQSILDDPLLDTRLYATDPTRLNLPDYLKEFLSDRVRGADWWQLQQQLLKTYLVNQQPKSAAIVASVMADASPMNAEIQNTAANLLRQVNQTNMARYHQLRSLAIDPNNEKYRLNYAFDLFLNQQFEQSLTVLENTLPLAKDKQRVTFFINKVKQARDSQP